MNLPIDIQPKSKFNLLLLRLKMLKIIFTKKKIMVTSIDEKPCRSTLVVSINIPKEQVKTYFLEMSNIVKHDQYLDEKLNQNISSIMNN